MIGSKKQDAAVLEEMHERWSYATSEWRDIRAEAAIDMRYVAGDPWDPKDRQARKDAGRVCLSLDELGQYVNQLINDVREHKRAIKVTPMGNGANDATANARANLIRQIEYRSNAQQAYTTTFENTVQRSYGFHRIKPRYVSDRTDDQELVIDPIMDPDSVTIDPDITKPDGSDMTYAWVSESWAIKDFKRKWPKATIQDFTGDMIRDHPDWVKEGRIRIAEYWKVETTPKTLYLLQTPDGGKAGIFEDELKRPDVAAMVQGWPTLKTRTVEAKSVVQYLTNGVELLDKTEWPGTSIPIVCCFGKVLYVDEGSGPKRKILSLVRLARDPQMLYCYYRTAEAEQVGMSTKFPYFVRRGSLKPTEQEKLAQSLHEPIAFITVEAGGDQFPPGYVPEMPVRNPFEPAIQALEVGAEGARRAIQAAMGTSPLPTSAQRRNEKSGIALQEMRNAEQQGSFHFIDHYEAAITRTGALLNELIPHYYDTAREIAVRSQADETSLVRINDPKAPDPETKQPVDMTAGEHDVTLSTGPSLESERAAANEYSDVFVQNLPAITPVIGPQASAKLLSMAIKLKNIGPLGDEMAEIVAPPEPGTPEEAQQQAAKMQQLAQALTQKVNELQQQIDTDGVKAKQQVAIETLRQEFEMRRAELEAKAKYDIERMKVVADLLKTRATLEQKQTEAMLDQATAELDRSVAMAGAQEERQAVSQEADKDRAFQAGEAERGRQHASQESDADRQMAAEQAAQAQLKTQQKSA